MSTSRIFPNRRSPIFKAAVILGSPRRDCRLMGICKVLSRDHAAIQAAADYLPNSPCCRMDANILIDELGRLCFHICEKTLCKKTREYHFQGDVFQMLDPYCLERSVCDALGQTEGLLFIPAGKYPVLPTGEGLLLSLPALLYKTSELSDNDNLEQPRGNSQFSAA